MQNACFCRSRTIGNPNKQEKPTSRQASSNARKLWKNTQEVQNGKFLRRKTMAILEETQEVRT